MVPNSREFGVPLTDVTAVFTITLWLRLVGATASGWMADRVGRKLPLMISILWHSICNFIAGFSPSFAFLFFFRALLGIGMGAERPAGASLAMESWPTRSRVSRDFHHANLSVDDRSVVGPAGLFAARPVRGRDVRSDAEFPDGTLPDGNPCDGSAFCFHQAAIFGGLIAPGLTFLAVDYNMGFVYPG